MASSVLKRIEALEAAIVASRSPQLLFVHTKSLADRISKALPDCADITLVHMRFPDEAAEQAYEANLRNDCPTENARLDRLLAGEVA
jgi:hypothetical protein